MNSRGWIVAVLGCVLSASAQAATYFKIADEWGTINPSGPRAATSGNRFWNAQGSSSGANASTAPFRFYTADLISQLDMDFGVGQWEVTNVNIVLSQNNAFFTAAGGIDLYWFESDSLAITNGQDESSDPGNFGSLDVSPLRYQSGANALDTITNDTQDASTIFGTFSLIDSFEFTSSGVEGDWPLDVLAPSNGSGGHHLIDPEAGDTYSALPNYGILPPIVNAARPFRSDTLENFEAYAQRVGSDLDISAIAADLEAGTSALSFMLVADASTAATYKGSPFNSDYPARMYIEVNALSNPSLDGDFNEDGTVDAADYALWRQSPETFGDSLGYDLWRANFGISLSGSGSSLNSSNAVPEPSWFAVLLVGIATLRGQRFARRCGRDKTC